MGIPPYECQSAVPTARVARIPTWKLAPLTAEVLGGRRLWFGGRFVLAVRNCCFRRFEASSRVGSVAERLGSRAAAAAQRKRTLGNRVGGAVPINRRHIITLDEIGSVLNHLDRCHLDVLRHCPCHRNNLAHTEQARALSQVGPLARVRSDGLDTGLAVSPAPRGIRRRHRTELCFGPLDPLLPFVNDCVRRLPDKKMRTRRVYRSSAVATSRMTARQHVGHQLLSSGVVLLNWMTRSDCAVVRCPAH